MKSSIKMLGVTPPLWTLSGHSVITFQDARMVKKLSRGLTLAGAILFVGNTIESEKRKNRREIAIRALFTGGANM
jgi:hypothetical protein